MRSRRLLVRTIVGRAAATLGLSAVSYLVLTFGFGAGMPYPLHLGLAAAVVGTREVLVRVPPSRDPDLSARLGHEPGAIDVPDRPFVRMRVWEERLELVGGDTAHFRRTVIPLLGELVDERLRLSIGIDRRSAPDRAAELLGSDLTGFLDQAGHKRPPRPSELAAAVTTMEDLWRRCGESTGRATGPT